ncbi:hypothetical protein RAMLITH_13400 [Ramlibacter sp. RBP-2]|uniref:Uncharacterized protein n=1 Tax=Ramlibacter lithotrophicus TaxID=2606681 RepID=A0A7X6DGP4_9BURK|nr:hypothetical protein [Ramlibacter lithotrophicus]NKE66823.1 hypothetical protein [Ramlibacter lithotrophicus]
MTEAQKLIKAAEKSRKPVFSKAARAMMERIQNDPAEAKAFLVSAGIHTKKGKLTAAYRITK